MATQYSNKPIVTDGLVYALDFGNPKSYVSGSTTAQSLIYNPIPARFSTLLPGDIAPPAAAYSVRKVVSSYTGSAMMVQSASVSQSIGFDADGNLDTASLASFAGSGDAFVKIWYDQSGNNNHATQSVVASQPKIYSGSLGSVILENSKPILQFDGVNDYLNITTPITTINSSIYTVINTNGTRGRLFSALNNSLYWFTGGGDVNLISISNGGNIVGTNTTYNNNQSLFSLTSNASGFTLHINNVLDINRTQVVNNFTINTILAYGTSQYTQANVNEIIIYNSNQSTKRINIEDNINRYYSIFTPTFNPIPPLSTGFLNFESNSGALLTNQSFPGFSYDQGNSTIMYVGETKGTSSLFTQDTDLSIVSTTSSIGFGSTSNNIGRTYPVTGLKHVTLRFSSGSVDCFVNGLPVPANSVFPTGSSVAGGKFAIPVYTGSLGLVQVYNRPLTGDEIWNNYQLTAPRFNLGPLENKPYTLDENAYLFLSQSGITDPIITSSIDTFVRGLKQNNLWDKMIAIYPFVGTGSEGINLTGSQSWNLKEPTTAFYKLGYNGSWEGSTSGSAPSGSGTYVTTGVAPFEYYPFKSNSNQHISILSYDTPVSSSYLMGTGMTEDLAISTLAGDYGTPAAAYSVRKVRTAYSGALMDVRRSLDNVTASIGYVESGDLDTGSLLDWVVPGRNNLPGEYDGLAAAYSLRKVSASYDGFAVKVRGDIENQTRDIGFDASGNLDTGSLLNFTATGSNTLAGSYSGLAAAYSLRRVVPGYAGDAIEVRSGSVSQSIGFDSIGNLDTGSLLTFVGSGDGFVKTWYDQSGNNNHATASSDTQQPKIASAGIVLTVDSKPAMQFDGINDQLNMAGLHGQSVLDTYFVTSTSDTQYLYPNVGTAGNFGFVAQQNSTSTFNPTFNYGTPSLYANGDLLPSTPRRVDIYNFLNGYKLAIHQGASTSGWSQYSFGSYNDYQYSGFLQELIAFTSSQAATRTRIENNINAYYGIYTTSSTSTENAFVSTWYDQSGNNRHATQVSASRQPLIVSSGSLITENGKPAVRFDGVNDTLSTATFASVPHPVTTFTTYKYTSVSNNSYGWIHMLSGNAGALRFGNANKITISSGQDLNSNTVATTNTPYITYALFNETNSEIRVNNETLVTGSSGTELRRYDRVVLGGNPGFPMEGTISENIIYFSNQSSSRALIENNINNYYNIYTGSNHGFVARWYDQSGNNRHATQTTTARQPLIVESGSLLLQREKPLIKSLNISTNLLTPLDFNVQLKSYNVITSTGKNVLFGSDDSANAILIADSGSSNSTINTIATILQRRNGTTYSPANRDTVNTDFSTSSLYYLDATYNFNTDNCFGYDKGANVFGMYSMQESVLYPSTLTQDPSIIEYGINNYYNIYPQTSSFATSSFTIKADPTSISGSINNKLTSGIASSGPLGLITVSRTGSNSLTLARNGAVTSFSTPASGALSSGIYLGAINNNGLALGNSPLNLSFASVGTGLTNAEVIRYNTLVGGLQMDLGRADTDAQSFFIQVLNVGGTLSPIEKFAIDMLVRQLKFNNLWTKMKALYPMVGGTANSHKFNLKDPRDTNNAFRLNFQGGWTHSSNGALANGSNAYADTYLNASSSLSTTNAHFSIYVRTFAGSGDRINGTYPGIFIDQFNNTSIFYGIGSETQVDNVVTTQLGFTQINALSNRSLFRNGINIHSGSTGGSLPSRTLWLGASNNNGTGQYWWNGTLSLVSIGDGLTNTESANLYTVVQAFQTTLGRQV